MRGTLPTSVAVGYAGGRVETVGVFRLSRFGRRRAISPSSDKNGVSSDLFARPPRSPGYWERISLEDLQPINPGAMAVYG
jgi:hypothetical protein